MRTDVRTTCNETDILLRGADLFGHAARIWPVPSATMPPIHQDAAAATWTG
jgi:hypothetical protein